VRANRIFVPGHIWHITHRCHQKEHLLKFSSDRDNWLKWLFQAKKRFKIKILNYNVTCNHIHLVVTTAKENSGISEAMQLVSSRVGQMYNRRKNRKGAFWEDRYHATAIENGQHLLNCMIYVDLNMVRARKVDHPRDWKHCGFYELTAGKQRYRIVDMPEIIRFCGFDSFTEFRTNYLNRLEKKLPATTFEPVWSKSIAVGSKDFAERFKLELIKKAKTAFRADRFSVSEMSALYSSGNHYALTEIDNSFPLVTDENLSKTSY
jgi:putative transposase